MDSCHRPQGAGVLADPQRGRDYPTTFGEFHSWFADDEESLRRLRSRRRLRNLAVHEAATAPDRTRETIEMTTVIRGPAWARKGLDMVGGRYPLRVERHLGRLVDGLLPGVISTTTHARSYALHTLVWARAAADGLDQDATFELLRRCEVVLAGVTLQHAAHLTLIPAAHGGEAVRRGIAESGRLEVAMLSERYTPNRSGFGGVYLGSEIRLGMAENGKPPTTGPRADSRLLHEALGDIVELAREDNLDLETLTAVQHLCACAAPTHADGPWLRRVFVNPEPLEEFEEADRARRETARLLGRVLIDGSGAPPHDVFRYALAFGDFIATDPVASSLPIAQAWRSAILRNYSVGAWRRIWSWLVDLLAEPASIAALADQLADALPDITVATMLATLPTRIRDGVLLPAEEELRAVQLAPDPLTEIQLLALGALRLDDLQGRALAAFAGREDENDLGPRWFRAQLDARRDDRLQDFGRWLAEMMVLRAQRVAMTKMDFNRATARFWIPSRIRERAGLISRLSREGWADVGLRIDTFSSVLTGCGVIARDDDDIWRLTDEGEALLV